MNKNSFTKAFRNIKEWLGSVFFVLLITLLLMSVIEGICSFLFVARSYVPKTIRQDAQYDADLGWVHIPNVSLKNLYGPGLDFHANAQGFRNKVNFTQHVSPNKIRIICTGDSFTMGYAVSDGNAWCDYLGRKDARLQTINMGIAGYGIDQSYLRYMRDGTTLDHQFQIFAFISNDFLRFGTTFNGYDKPYLELKDNILTVKNTPVPHRSYYLSSTFNSLLATIEQLRFVPKLMHLYHLIMPAGTPREDLNAPQRTHEITLKIFDNLLAANKLKNSTLIVVYYPMQTEHIDMNENLRNFLQEELKKRGIIFIDLTDDFLALSKQDFNSMFRIFHYSERGNEMVANLIFNKLQPLLPPPAPAMNPH